jgi:hypothetical protein
MRANSLIEYLGFMIDESTAEITYPKGRYGVGNGKGFFMFDLNSP